MRNWQSAALAAFLVALAGGPHAAAAAPAWTLTIGPGDMQNNFNVPKFSLGNGSTGSEAIRSFTLTIGDAEGFFFDFVADLSSRPAGREANVATEATVGASLTAGDRGNDGRGVSVIEWAFDHFDPGELLMFEADIDPYGGGPGVDGRRALFAPDSLAVATVGFDDGTSSALVLEGSASGQAFVFDSGVASVAVVSEPGALALWLAAPLAGLRRRSRPALPDVAVPRID